MKKNNVKELVQPGDFKDQLTEILRQGARNLVRQVVEAEFASFLQSHGHEELEDGRKRIVRHGHLPERKVITGYYCGKEAKKHLWVNYNQPPNIGM